MSSTDPQPRELGDEAAVADPDVFRDVIGHFATGVAVITAQESGVPYGVTVSALSSLSLDPPMLLVCLNRTSRTQGAIERSGVFGVNVLGERQGGIAVRFATDRDDKFDDLVVVAGGCGAPLLAGALAHLECRVVEEAVGGTHTVFISAVERAERFDGTPLAYYRGEFGRLTLDHDALTGVKRPVRAGFIWDASA
jgi:flavin reductase (DIM6/NTAB) family NADH-FMN oxidoreductase RutF